MNGQTAALRNTPPVERIVAHAVEEVISKTPTLQKNPELAQRIAKRMHGVCLSAARLIEHELALDREIQSRSKSKPPLTKALTASEMAPGRAVEQAAQSVQAIRQAVNFPEFVTSLINGVFQAITRSNLTQLEAFADMLSAIDATGPEFAANQISKARAGRWLMDRFGVFDMEVNGDEVNLFLRDDAEMPETSALAQVLGATESEMGQINTDELSTTLLPLVQRKLGRERQRLLATMVSLGLSRIVVDAGRLQARMELVVDARSVAEQTTSSRTDVRHQFAAQASFGIGQWGASASSSTNVGYVRSDEQFSREEIAARAGLRSSVDLTFRTEHLPLDRMANRRQRKRIDEQNLVPPNERDDAPFERILSPDPERKTKPGNFEPIPAMPTPPPLPPPAQNSSDESKNKKSSGEKSNEAKPNEAKPTKQTAEVKK